MGKIDYYERRQERIDRYNTRAEAASMESDAHYKDFKSWTDAIPFGQPIVNDRTRRGYDKMNRCMDKCLDAYNKAEYYEHKAESAQENNAISSDAPDAIERLEEKISALEHRQAVMVAGNKYYRKNKTLQGFDMMSSEEQAEAEKTINSSYFYGIPFPFTTQNNANIRAAKKRLELLKASESMGEKEEEISGVKIVNNTSENRVQIIFHGKPDEEVRRELKGWGFKWSPYNMAWQKLSTPDNYEIAHRIIAKLYGGEHE